MTNSKMTREEMMTVVKALVENSEIANKSEIMEFCDKQIASFSKKSTSQADKDKAELNKKISATILEVLAERDRMRNSDLTKVVNEIMASDFQPQKISNLVSAMVKSGDITRTVDKKVAYFSV